MTSPERWVGKGLCRRCGVNPFKQNRTSCQECADEQAAYSKKRRVQLLQKGLCSKCAINKNQKNKSICKQCSGIETARSKKRRIQFLKKGLCYACGKNKKTEGLKVCERCRQICNKTRRAQTKQRKELIYGHYGNKCNCCGETEPMFLTIDHINGDGAEHRRSFNKLRSSRRGNTGSDIIYKWIVKNNFPKNKIQLLCMNCNFAKYRNGGVCPHQQKG